MNCSDFLEDFLVNKMNLEVIFDMTNTVTVH